MSSLFRFIIALLIAPSLLAQEKIAWLGGIDPKSKESVIPSLRASGFSLSFEPASSSEKNSSEHFSDWLDSQAFVDTYLWVEIHGPTDPKQIDQILTHLDQKEGLSSTFLLIDGSSPELATTWSPKPSPRRSSAVKITSAAEFAPLLSRTLHTKNLAPDSSSTLHTSLFQTILSLKQNSPKDFHHLSSNPPSKFWWQRPPLEEIDPSPLFAPLPEIETPPAHEKMALAEVLAPVEVPTPVPAEVPAPAEVPTPVPVEAPASALGEMPALAKAPTQPRPTHLSEYFENSPLSETYLIRQSKTLRLAQSQLKSLDLYHAKIDGSPGPGTHQAILSFQEQRQIPITGTLDATTLEALDLQIPAHEFQNDIRGLNPLKDSSKYRWFSSTDRRRVIKEIQRTLQQENLYQGSLDGSPGPMFFQALLDFQTTHQLSKTLTIDSNTQSELTRVGMRQISPTPRPIASKPRVRSKPRTYSSKPKPKTKRTTKSRPKPRPSSPKVLPFLE